MSQPKLSILTPVWNQEELVIRTMDSIPRRDDIEVLVCDDGSTDNTLKNLREYAEKTDLPMVVIANEHNLGVAATANRLLRTATGEWFHFLMSDDYVYTDKYAGLIDSLYETDADIVAMDLIINSGEEYVLCPEKDEWYCAQACRFIKRELVKGITYPEEKRVGEDWFFHRDMMKRNPKVFYSKVPAYHYNYPRRGSLVNLRLRGLIQP